MVSVFLVRRSPKSPRRTLALPHLTAWEPLPEPTIRLSKNQPKIWP